ncbi:MAG: Gfo/Idh/MocA family oxidoreductase, partial [Dehalococcoidales bacterium]|nr:Gfo/Idh/MocA family oxidoreductase [Dehalococcoidales bacterium]
MIKAAVVGLGAMGQHHVRVYKELGCELAGVADADINRAREIGEKYNTRYFSDYRNLLGCAD